MKKLNNGLRGKGVFFWLNILLLILFISLFIPAFDHNSSKPWLFGRYSVNYTIYLTLLVTAAIFCAYIIFTKDRRINRNWFFLVLVTFVASEGLARNVGLPKFNENMYKTPRPYFMFGGEANERGYVKNYRKANKLEFEMAQLNHLGFRGKMPTVEKRDEF